MTEPVLIEMVKQTPFAAILFGVILVFLRHLEKKDDARMAHEKDMETMRINAAKEQEALRREHDTTLNNMWAVNIKNIVEQQQKTGQLIADALAEHEKASRERYEKMGITKDLFEAAKETRRKK